MLSFIKRINKFIGVPKLNNPSVSIFWSGAFYGLTALGLAVMMMSGAFFRVGLPWWLTAAFTLLVGILAFWVFRIIGTLIYQAIERVPIFIFVLLFSTIATILLARYIRFGLPPDLFYYGFGVAIIAVAFLFGSAKVLKKKGIKGNTGHLISTLTSTAIIIYGLYFLGFEGNDPYKISFEPTPVQLLSEKGIQNPGQKGEYKINYFTYGSGTDNQREEFGKGVKYMSQTVDASLMLPDWKGSKAKWRERYWSFGVKEFPLNGRVWMPNGEGKFPIILIVHGNHGMEDYSDPGYAYLGEHLASKGFITISIDENFINGTWSGDFRGAEMPARGWLLLKHLEQWRLWNKDKAHELYQKADLNNVILAGHSRGGEAAPIAAHFNTLTYFPDNANEKFDFNFGIKGVIAIAPTDKRYDRRIKLENVNYLSLQGSYDSDEASFFGFRQFQRIDFTDSLFYFKSGVYIHGANHGQFNSTWGKYDGGPPFKWLLNTAPQISMNEQQQIALVYISAFAEAVLHQNKDYFELFKNSASGSDWLPTSVILNTYKDSNTKTLVNFEEDIDLTTGTAVGSKTKANDLKIWRETTLKFRDKDTQANNVVILGWEKDSTSADPSYNIILKSPIKIDSALALVLYVGQGDESELKRNKNANPDSLSKISQIDFEIELADSLGNTSAINLEAIKKITPRLKVQYVKLKGLNQESFGDIWEPTLEFFEIPMSKFLAKKDALKHIKHIKLKFNRTDHGVLIIDEIGLNH